MWSIVQALGATLQKDEELIEKILHRFTKMIKIWRVGLNRMKTD